MRVRFWGVRGSVPWATPSGIGHGCNTLCIEISDEKSGSTIILDAGSGIVGLGASLDGPPRDLPIILTHYHWDHLQGLPFLAQLYEPGWKPEIFAPKFESYDPAWVEAIFRSPFFPVPVEHLPNRPAIEVVRPGEMRIGGFDVTAVGLIHPGERSPIESVVSREISSTPPTTSSEIPSAMSGSRTSRRGRRRSFSIPTSRLMRSSRTRGGVTATGARAPGSPRRTTSAVCGCFITNRAGQTSNSCASGATPFVSFQLPKPRARERPFSSDVRLTPKSGNH